MPSRLRFQSDIEPTSTGTIRPSTAQPPQKKQKMSLTQTYYIASSARTKLGREATKPDHNLRLLVGHANLLDSLMLDLQDAEREQEAWFNQTVQKAQKAEEPKHIQWADTIVEEEEEEDSDSDSDYDEEDFDMLSSIKTIRHIRQAPVSFTSEDIEEEDEDEEGFYDDEADSGLGLVRTQSHSVTPPELVDDSDSEDESPPTSPPQPNFDINMFDEKAAHATETALIDEGFFIPQRNTPMIAAY